MSDNRLVSNWPSSPAAFMSVRSALIPECPKCGATCEDSQISVSIEQTFDPKEKKWVDTKRTVRGNISSTFVKLPKGAKCICTREDDHLHKRCNVCNFYWSTDTVDSAIGEANE